MLSARRSVRRARAAARDPLWRSSQTACRRVEIRSEEGVLLGAVCWSPEPPASSTCRLSCGPRASAKGWWFPGWLRFPGCPSCPNFPNFPSSPGSLGFPGFRSWPCSLDFQGCRVLCCRCTRRTRCIRIHCNRCTRHSSAPPRHCNHKTKTQLNIRIQHPHPPIDLRFIQLTHRQCGVRHMPNSRRGARGHL